ncbi:MAG: hypothetical protein Q8Q09_02170 [Deltaproteobacteria bacterium]|nr:hypothetical protein [Deltaproteobacteria bacterium]
MVASRGERRSRRVGHGIVAAAMVGAVMFPQVLHGSIEEQRARLPPAATCQDPVEGVWMARVFHQPGLDWYIYTLEIHRTAPGASTLTGELHARFWNGPRNVFEPQPCTPGALDRTVFMTGAGRANGLDVDFYGTSWRPETLNCGPAGSMQWISYNLDHFSGRIDPAIQEFQSVNNDGGEAVNEPSVFRRIRCFDGPSGPSQRPNVTVSAPPLMPPQRAGCARFVP